MAEKILNFHFGKLMLNLKKEKERQLQIRKALVEKEIAFLTKQIAIVLYNIEQKYNCKIEHVDGTTRLIF